MGGRAGWLVAGGTQNGGANCGGAAGYILGVPPTTSCNKQFVGIGEDSRCFPPVIWVAV